MSKPWWKSRAIWTGIIALGATILQAKYGFVVSPEYQGYALAVVMILLRIVTKEEVTLT